MTPEFGRLALHLWTIDTTPLATALDAAREGGFDAVELRRSDFKRCFDAGMTSARVLDLIRNSRIPVGVLGVEYGILFATGADPEQWERSPYEIAREGVVLTRQLLRDVP
jgi:sugar phosphate isomerase/epimerase